MSTYTYHDHEDSPDPPHQGMYLRKMLKHLDMHTRVDTVLDAGCGDGNFAASLAQAGYTMRGIEMSDSGLRIAQGRGCGTFAKGSVYEDLLAPFEDLEEVDAVIAVEVIEHLFAPRDFVDRALEALRPGGLLVLTCPYWGYGKNILLALAGKLDALHSPLWDGGHIKHWSRKTLTVLVEERGFEVIAFEGADGRPPYLWNGMMLVSRKP